MKYLLMLLLAGCAQEDSGSIWVYRSSSGSQQACEVLPDEPRHLPCTPERARQFQLKREMLRRTAEWQELEELRRIFDELYKIEIMSARRIEIMVASPGNSPGIWPFYTDGDVVISEATCQFRMADGRWSKPWAARRVTRAEDGKGWVGECALEDRFLVDLPAPPVSIEGISK